jgi:hypothetical protein
VSIDNKVAMTGELSIRGQVKPVGGIVAKIEAARWAGAERILIPHENWQEMMKEDGSAHIIPVRNLGEVLRMALLTNAAERGVVEEAALGGPVAVAPRPAGGPTVDAPARERRRDDRDLGEGDAEEPAQRPAAAATLAGPPGSPGPGAGAGPTLPRGQSGRPSPPVTRS